MDYSNILLLAVLAVSVHVILGATSEPSDWLTKSINAANENVNSLKNQGTRHSADVKNNKVTADKPSTSCCYNGGICIMNAFCHCKKNFYGRYCEHQVRHRSCGTIEHGTWMAAGCHLCHCFDGEITCKTTTIRGCDKLSYIEGHEKDPEYLVGMDKQVEDYDVFYAYNDATATGASSGSTQHTSMSPIMTVATVLALVVCNFVS